MQAPSNTLRAIAQIARLRSCTQNVPSAPVQEEFRSLAKVDFVSVPYKGSAPAVADLLGGRVQAYFDGPASVGPHIASGSLRVLGVMMRRRTPTMPTVATMAELGYPMQSAAWAGLLAPAGTPKPIVARLNAAVLEAIADTAFQAKLRAIGAEPLSSTPDEFADLLQREADRWPRIAKELGIKAE